MEEGRLKNPAPPIPFPELFWDCDPGGVDAASHADFVAGRLMESGGLDAIRWLRTTYGDEALADYLRRTRGRAVERRRLRFWQVILGLPVLLVDQWLDQPGRAVWDSRNS